MPMSPFSSAQRSPTGDRDHLAAVPPDRRDRPLRIAVIGHHVAPIAPPFAGGVESLTWYLTRWLADRGHEVTLFALPGSAVPGVRCLELDVAHRFSRHSRTDVSMPPDAFMAAHHAYQSLLMRLASGHAFDVIHNHSLHYLPVALAALVPGPKVLTLHTPPTPWLESALVQRFAGLHVLAVSPTTAADWADTTAVDAVIPNGIDTTRFGPGPGGDAAIWFGRIVPEKAPHLAIRAARRAGLTIRLAGPVADPVYHREHVRPLLDDPGVRYLGHLDHTALHREVARSAVALQTPAWDEPFCLAAVEAMASGTPVAAFARGALPAVIGARGGVLALPGDVEDLARAVIAARALPRAAVRAHAVRRHDLDTMGRAHERVYRALVAADREAGDAPPSLLAV